LLARPEAACVFAYVTPRIQERLLHELGEAESSVLVTGLKPDERTRLLDVLPTEVTRRLLANLPPGTPVGRVVDRPLVTIAATASRSELVASFRKYRRIVLPVVDDDGVLLGIVTLDDTLKIADAETTRDAHRSGGMESLDAPYLSASLSHLIKKRAGWLSALFLGEMLTATAMGHFQAEIAHVVVLALFVPLIISSGGNSGSQAATLMVRSLALHEVQLRDWLRVFSRELLGGLFLGVWLGMIGFARILLWQKLHFFDYGPHHLRLAMAVWASLIGVVTFGSLAGSMLPFALKRLRLDPATSSAPFVATLVDVTGLIIYFTVANLIFRGLAL
ncbi:MAG: magnesium transporter, partial [Candidatus Eisenbacteria bacterium]|nr:magnesium transporter [Candidatus Eisenbacteria bacterium]